MKGLFIAFLMFLLWLFPKVYSDNVIKIIAVGDTMIGSKENKIPTKQQFDSFVETMKNFTKDVHIVFANLEGAIVDQDDKPIKCNVYNRGKTCFEFGIPRENILYLKQAGFNVFGLNNNHILDYGFSVYQKGLKYLNEIGIRYSGLVGDIAYFHINSKKIALIAFGFSSDPRFYSVLNIEKASQIIRDLKSSNDIVIVSAHIGAEGDKSKRTRNEMEYFLGTKRGNPVAFARAMIDSGADIFIGHGPHLPRAIELYKNKFIAYSLGNFFTYGGFSLSSTKKLAPMLYLEIDANNGEFVKGRIISFLQEYPGFPIIDPTHSSAKEIAYLSKIDFPESPLIVDDQGNIQKAEK